jgi:hypothetical protein
MSIFSNTRNILLTYIVLAVLLISGITIFNQNRGSDLQAQSTGSTMDKQMNAIRTFFDPRGYTQKLNAYKNAFIKEITGLYQSKALKYVNDYQRMRSSFYVRPITNSQLPKQAFQATEYNCFFNYLVSSTDLIDCALYKFGVGPVPFNFAGQLPKNSPFIKEMISLITAYSDWFKLNVDPIAKAVAEKYRNG